MNLDTKQLGLFAPGYTPKDGDGVMISDLDDPILDQELGDQAAELRADVDLIQAGDGDNVILGGTGADDITAASGRRRFAGATRWCLDRCACADGCICD